MRQTISCSYELTNDYYSGLIFLWHFVLCHPENSLATYLHLVPLWRVTQKHFGDLLTITPFMTMESEKSVVWLTTNLRFLSLATSGGGTNTQKFHFGQFQTDLGFSILYQATKTNRLLTCLSYDISFYDVEISSGLTCIFFMTYDARWPSGTYFLTFMKKSCQYNI